MSICFSFSILDEAELKDVFVTLGSNDLLDSTRADLTGIIKVNDDLNSRLSLEHFVYKTRVDITGTSDQLSDDLTGNRPLIVEGQCTSLCHFHCD